MVVRIVNVPLGKRSYEIKLGTGLLAKLGPECRKLELAKRCAIITDSRVGRLYGAAAATSLKAAGFDPVSPHLSSGRGTEESPSVEACYNQLAEHRLERKSFIVALGGGVVGDLAGFVAATYLRGIPFVQVPTTLLAQVDSSVGGKMGSISRPARISSGAFHQPRLVLCDLRHAGDPARPRIPGRPGGGHQVRHHLRRRRCSAIWSAKCPSCLRATSAALAPVIARCCEIKADVVGQDETESGLRAILNFGHTIGHALEAISRYGKFPARRSHLHRPGGCGRLSVELLGSAAARCHAHHDAVPGAGLASEPCSSRQRSKRRLLQP